MTTLGTIPQTAIPTHTRESSLRQHLRHLWLYWRLAPLWQAMTRLEPHVVLPLRPCDSLAALIVPHILTLLLRRRVKEIMDARRHLGITPPPSASGVVLHVIPGYGALPRTDGGTPPTDAFNRAAIGHSACREAYYLCGLLIGQPSPRPTVLLHPDAYADQLRYLVAISWSLRQLLHATSSHPPADLG